MKPRNSKTARITFAVNTIFAAVLLSFVGCTAETAGEESSAMQEGNLVDEETRAEVEEILEMGGFDTSTLGFHDDGTIVVEGDITMRASDILEDGFGQIEKGYWYEEKGKADDSIPIFITAYTPLSDSWKWAIILAAIDWNEHTNLEFRLSADPPWFSQAIGFAMRKFDDRCLPARASWPNRGRAGGVIYLNSDYYCTRSDFGRSCRNVSIENLPMEQKVAIAAHEIGHCVGLSHPIWDKATHIRNTARIGDPDYYSIMWVGCAPDDQFVTSTLSADDIKSVNTLYP